MKGAVRACACIINCARASSSTASHHDQNNASGVQTISFPLSLILYNIIRIRLVNKASIS